MIFAPVGVEDLRMKHAITSNVRCMAQCKSPGRSVLADLQTSTWQDHMGFLFDSKHSERQLNVGDREVAGFKRNLRISYESELRCLALSLFNDRGLSIQAALETANADREHRTEHWVTMLFIANESSSHQLTTELPQTVAREYKNRIAPATAAGRTRHFET